MDKIRRIPVHDASSVAYGPYGCVCFEPKLTLTLYNDGTVTLAGKQRGTVRDGRGQNIRYSKDVLCTGTYNASDIRDYEKGTLSNFAHPEYTFGGKYIPWKISAEDIDSLRQIKGYRRIQLHDNTVVSTIVDFDEDDSFCILFQPLSVSEDNDGVFVEAQYEGADIPRGTLSLALTSGTLTQAEENKRRWIATYTPKEGTAVTLRGTMESFRRFTGFTVTGGGKNGEDKTYSMGISDGDADALDTITIRDGREIIGSSGDLKLILKSIK